MNPNFIHIALIVFLHCIGYTQSGKAQVAMDTLRNIDSVMVKRSIHKTSAIGSLTISKAQIEAVPKMLGISDPLKAVQFLPGFGNGGDGNSGLLYRGLSSGHNGYFYNGVRVHNPAHFFGLFPLFNTDVVKEVKVYNSIVPGNLTGRLSGTIDVKGNWQVADTTVLKGEMSLFHIGGGTRIEKDSSTLLEVFWRNTFMNKTLWPLVGRMVEDQKGMHYDLYDFNINAARRYGKNVFRTFLYTGRDRTTFDLYEGNVNNGMDWGNTVWGLAYQYPIRSNLQLESTLGYSGYSARIGLDFLDSDFLLRNKQRTWTLDSKVVYDFSVGRLETGLSYTSDLLHSRIDEAASVDGPNRYINRQQLLKYFAQLQSRLSDRVEVDLATGLQYISGTHNRLFFNPSLSVQYRPDSRNTVFVAATTAYQPVHNLPLTSINIPIDYVIHSDADISASSMRELSSGYRYMHNRMEISIDGYYRWMNGLKEFDGNIIALQVDKGIQKHVVDGIGVSYGLDFFTKMIWSRNYLTVNYSFARSFRRFDALNNGGWYRYIFDRPHNLTAVNAYKVSPRLSFSASFMWSSGSNYTPVLGLYYFNNSLVGEYGAKNSARMDAYHRLDLGLEYILKRTDKSRQTLGFSVINVYNRANPIFKYFSYERGYLEEYGAFKMLQKDGAHLPVLPAITYTLELL